MQMHVVSKEGNGFYLAVWNALLDPEFDAQSNVVYQNKEPGKRGEAVERLRGLVADHVEKHGLDWLPGEQREGEAHDGPALTDAESESDEHPASGEQKEEFYEYPDPDSDDEDVRTNAWSRKGADINAIWWAFVAEQTRAAPIAPVRARNLAQRLTVFAHGLHGMDPFLHRPDPPLKRGPAYGGIIMPGPTSAPAPAAESATAAEPARNPQPAPPAPNAPNAVPAQPEQPAPFVPTAAPSQHVPLAEQVEEIIAEPDEDDEPQRSAGAIGAEQIPLVVLTGAGATAAHQVISPVAGGVRNFARDALGATAATLMQAGQLAGSATSGLVRDPKRAAIALGTTALSAFLGYAWHSMFIRGDRSASTTREAVRPGGLPGCVSLG